MGKTIRSASKAHNESDSFENKMMKVKQKLISTKADQFMKDFRITEYSVDSVFPNQFNETVEQYAQRNIKNYTVIIDRLKEMITVLADPTSGRPIAGEFNWILLAIDHHVEIDDDLFSTMSFEQKNTLLQKLIEESEIRLTMLQSIPVSLSLVSSTTESENTMNSTTTTDQINDVINSAASNGAKHVEQATQTAADTVKAATEKVAETIVDAAEKVADKASKPSEEAPKEAAKPATESTASGWKKAAKYVGIVAATAGAVAGGYWLYKNKFAGSFGSVVSNAADVASEQVVGG